MTDEELAEIIDELSGKSPEEIDKGIEEKCLSPEDTEIVLNGIEAIQNEIDELKDFVEEKSGEPAANPAAEEPDGESVEESQEKSGADDTLTEDLSEKAESVDTDGDGEKDAVMIEENVKHGDEDDPHAKGVIKPVNILKALSAFKY